MSPNPNGPSPIHTNFSSITNANVDNTNLNAAATGTTTQNMKTRNNNNATQDVSLSDSSSIHILPSSSSNLMISNSLHNNNMKVISPTIAALSTAAAVAAISGSFQPQQLYFQGTNQSRPTTAINNATNICNINTTNPTSLHINDTSNQQLHHPGAPSENAANPITATGLTFPSLHPQSATTMPQNQLVYGATVSTNTQPNHTAPGTSTPVNYGNIPLAPAADPNSQLHHHSNLHLNQHPLNVLQSGNRNVRPNAKVSTPSIFANMALRRGKWTVEEERLANILIEEFGKGTIVDCENGCTLRSYLSRKLHCAPMRISKKYAGKSIGKHVFLSRIPGMNSITAQEHIEKIRDLEFHFHMSLLKEGAAPTISQNIVKLSTSVAGNIVGGGNHGCPPGNMPIQHHAHSTILTNGTAGPFGGNASALSLSSSPGSSIFMNANNSQNILNVAKKANFPVACPANSTFQISNVTQPPNSFLTLNAAAPCTTFQWFPTGNADAPSAPVPSSSYNSSVNAHPTNPATIQQHLFNAFKEAQTSTTQSTTATSIANLDINFQQQQDQNHSTHSSQANNQSCQGIPNMYDQKKNIKTTFSNNMVKAPFDQGQAPDINANSDKNDRSGEIQNTGQAQQNWLSETMDIIPTLDPSSYMGQFSPTYTSKSFDDLHQFIGKDCPLLPNSTMDNSSASVNKVDDTVFKGPATEAADKLQNGSNVYFNNNTGNLSAADAYAMFAQQSAMAVSKHSAYARPLSDKETITNSSAATTSAIESNQQNQEHSTSHQTGVIYQVKQEILASPSTVASSASAKTSNQPNSSSGISFVTNNSATKSSSIVFNATNLQIHSAAAEEMERVDQKSNANASSQKDTSSQTSSSPGLGHGNVVSGSDRSMSEVGVESSVGGSGSSGSDNSSDNSDSDEGQASAGSRRGKMKRVDESNEETYHNNDDNKQNTKRQKCFAGQ
mmetsp:Transcript_1349/g.1816  ORF Transcript_1349/g.1816 Transcript_1349/m.1816 type:complete len:953 (-) Transcript_1349:744-3602(-)